MLAAVAVVFGGCQSTEPSVDPAVACGSFDLEAVRASVHALPGWTATTRGALMRGGLTTYEETQIVRFVAPDRMMIEWPSDGELATREWYLRDRAWLAKIPGQPAQNGVPFFGDDIRTLRTPPIEVDLEGRFSVADSGSPGACVLASEDGDQAVYATLAGVYAGERSAQPTGDLLGVRTVSFDPNVPSIPPPPT